MFTELGDPPAIQQSGDAGRGELGGEQADAERADDADDEVDADDVQGIVIPEPVFQADRPATDRPGDRAHEHGSDGRERAARGRDRDQPTDEARRCTEGGQHAVAEALDDEPAGDARRAGQAGW